MDDTGRTGETGALGATESMAVVQADIAEARQELQETVDLLADRLNPKKRADEMATALTEEARQRIERVSEASRRVLAEAKDMTPDEAAAAARKGVERAGTWLEDEQHRRLALVAGGLLFLLAVRRARRHRRRA